MGYPNDILTSRAVIEPGKYAIIPPEGRVHNVVPGFENCTMTILGSPKLGAQFVDYHLTFHEGGKNTQGYGGQDDIQTFVYVFNGKVKAKADDEEFILEAGGYLYCPPSVTLYLENLEKGDSELFLYKKKHKPLEGHKPWVVSGNTNELEEEEFMGMHNMLLKDLLPTDIAFDMNFHILTFLPAGSHPFIETHVQEHGAYLTSGEGLYNLENKWVPVKKDDYIYMAPYVLQAAYATGREPLSYLYSKDCNRDEDL